MVDLIEQSRLAVDELIDVAGRATIETVLQLSAEQVAGPRRPGKQREEMVWHGSQRGRVCLKERKPGVRKPRLRVAARCRSHLQSRQMRRAVSAAKL